MPPSTTANGSDRSEPRSASLSDVARPAIPAIALLSPIWLAAGLKLLTHESTSNHILRPFSHTEHLAECPLGRRKYLDRATALPTALFCRLLWSFAPEFRQHGFHVFPHFALG